MSEVLWNSYPDFLGVFPMSNRASSPSPTIYQLPKLTRREDPLEVVSLCLSICSLLRNCTFFLCSCAACFFALVTVDVSNNCGLASRKDAQTPTKSSSSGEPGSLCWQMEVGAVVNSEFQVAVGFTNIILMIAGKTTHGFSLPFIV